MSDIRVTERSESSGARSWREAGIATVGRRSVAGRIYEQIMGLLASGWLRPGDRIPTEAELSELFDAGRSSVREAINMLAGANLIRRDRHGTYVTQAVQDVIAQGLHTGILLGGATVHDLFAARKACELGIIELVAERADEALLEDVRRWTVAPDSVTSVEDFRHIDMEFHSAIATATGNTVIAQMYLAVRNILFQTHAYYALLGANDESQARDLIRSSLLDHVQVYDALSRRDPVLARDAMLAHYRHLEERLTRGAQGGS